MNNSKPTPIATLSTEEVLIPTADYLTKIERIFLATALTASTQTWQKKEWTVELCPMSKAVLEMDQLTDFKLPPWPQVLADDIAAALGCINARTHLKTLSVPHLDRTLTVPHLEVKLNIDAHFLQPLVGSSVLETLDCEQVMTNKKEIFLRC